ncbi:hypothetical protein BC829DRAFT_447093 [Chytridium lagenaria]|nr:hypothetical protein BC829DRAFT_447093 [Chytridium lagenaria]
MLFQNFLSDPCSSLPPAYQSPILTILRDGDDGTFLSVMGLNRSGFNNLLAYFSPEYEVRSGPGCVEGQLASALALVLHFYRTQAKERTLCELFCIPPATLSRTLRKAEMSLSLALQKVNGARIVWPSLSQQRDWAIAVEQHDPLMRFILFGADGCIAWFKHNCPGSWDDGDMSRDMQDKLMDSRINLMDHGILADSAFPVDEELANRIATPLKEGDLERVLPANLRTSVQAQNDAIISISQAANWGMQAVPKVGGV